MYENSATAAPDRNSVPLSIAVIVRNFDGRGVQRAQLRLATEYVRRGHRVDIIVFERRGELGGLLPAAATVTCFDCKSANRSIPKFVDYLRQRRPDALICAEDHVNVAALVARALVPWVSTRISVSCRVSPDLWYGPHTPRTSKQGVLGRLVGWVYPLATARVMLSGKMAGDYARLFGLDRSSLTVIPNPVTLDSDPRSTEPVSHPWLMDSGLAVVLSVGALTALKGVDFLMRGFARAAGKRPELRLIIVGEGPERERLEALAVLLGIEGRVAFFGFTPYPASLMRQASMFVMSSRSEGFGNTLAEAICALCPPIATRCGGGAIWLMEEGRLGPLLDYGDEAALAAAIDRTLQAPPSHERLARSARRFAVANVAAKYLTALGFEVSKQALPDRKP